MYDLSAAELQMLQMLAEGQREEEIAQALNITIPQYRAGWRDLAEKFETKDPQTIEGAGRALTFERARSAKLEAALHSSEARFRAVMDLSPNAVMIVDGSSGQILQANSSCKPLFGYESADLCAMVVEQLIEVDLNDKHEKLREGFLRSFRKRDVGYHPPIFAVRKDGSKVEVIIGLTTSSSDEVMVICTAT